MVVAGRSWGKKAERFSAHSVFLASGTLLNEAVVEAGGVAAWHWGRTVALKVQ